MIFATWKRFIVTAIASNPRLSGVKFRTIANRYCDELSPLKFQSRQRNRAPISPCSLRPSSPFFRVRNNFPYGGLRDVKGSSVVTIASNPRVPNKIPRDRGVSIDFAISLLVIFQSRGSKRSCANFAAIFVKIWRLCDVGRFSATSPANCVMRAPSDHKLLIDICNGK